MALGAENLTQNHWAKRLGLSRGHLSEILNGKHPYLSQKTREKFLSGLGLEFSDLFETEHETSGWAYGTDDDFRVALADRYEILEEIGSGGMGTVFRARDLKHGRTVAVKVISPEAISGVGAKKFMREIRFMSRLQHHNVLEVLDSGKAAGLPFYVMRCISDGSLRQLLSTRGKQTLANTLRIVKGVAEGLEHAHGKRVVHCDVKPENILLSDNHAYVADFGIARTVHAEALEWGRREGIDSSAGTPAYVSPEQASGELDLTASTDVYSLGCVVYEMLSGEAPFRGANTMQVVARRFSKDPPELLDVPPGVAAAVRSAMDFHPEKRPPSVAHFARDLEVAIAVESNSLSSTAGLVVRKALAPVRRFRHQSKRRSSVFDVLLLDVSYAVRKIFRKPFLSAAAVVVLALGIGAVTSVFSVFSERLWPIPEVAAAGDVYLAKFVESDGRTGDRLPYNLALKIDESSEQLAGYYRTVAAVATGGAARRAFVDFVSPGFPRLMGLRPLIGSGFDGVDFSTGQAAAIVSHDFWVERLDSEEDVIGTEITINRRPVVVVGVAQPGFYGLDRNSRAVAWMPFEIMFSDRPESFDWPLLKIAAIVSVDSEPAHLVPSLTSIVNEGGDNRRVVMASFREGTGEGMGALLGAWRMLTVLGVAVLVVACLNVSNLLLAEAIRLKGETTLRAALGASRRRLLLENLLQPLIIATIACGFGLALAWWVLHAVPGWLPTSDPPLLQRVRVRGSAVVVSVFVAFLAAILSSVAPAWSAIRLKLSGVGGSLVGARRTDRSSGLGTTLVVAQVAFSAALISIAAQATWTMFSHHSTDLGYEEEGRFQFRLNVSDAVGDKEAGLQIAETIRTRIASAAGVESATLIAVAPLNSPPLSPISFVGTPDTVALVKRLIVGPDYFRTAGNQLLVGQDFGIAPDTNLAIVSDSAAKLLWPNGADLGASFVDERGNAYQVGGIASDGTFGLGFVQPTVYLPFSRNYRSVFAVVVNSRVPRDQLAEIVHSEVRRVDPLIPSPAVIPVEEWFERSWVLERATGTLARLLGFCAFLIASVGIYGRFLTLVTSQTREIAVRMALGSHAGKEIGRVLRGSVTTTAIGLAFGVVLTLAAHKLVSTIFVMAVGSIFVAVGASVVLLGTVTLLATLPSGVRAASVDPAQVLRSDQ